MVDSSYGKINALIVDDFGNFRATLNNILMSLGIRSVDSVASGEEALQFCKVRTYDLILCDQNLGKGKSGQQVLEELRVTSNPCRESLFILVSAESSKSIIMAAYDYEPDAYLTKPLNAKVLDQRLSRLFEQHVMLKPTYAARKKGDLHTAIDLCTQLIDKGGRNTNVCQKLLGQLYLQNNDVASAEMLYRTVLNQRELEWAQLGMVKTKIAQGDLLSAQQWLGEILQRNPQCLKAYDFQVEIHREQGNTERMQTVLQTVTDLSPLSILRQQALGDVALQNDNLLIATTALRHAVKLGDNSFLDNAHVHTQFAQAAIKLSTMDEELGRPFLRDALKGVAEIEVKFGESQNIQIQAKLLETQLQVCSGNENRAIALMTAAQAELTKPSGGELLESRIEMIRVLRLLGRMDEAEVQLKALLLENVNNEEALQKLDVLLEEPRSEKNKLMVAEINKKGIAAYKNKDFHIAEAAFNTALQKVPHHIGLRLNYIQTLIDTLKINFDDQISKKIHQSLSKCEASLNKSHVQYPRYHQLQIVYNDLTKAQKNSELNDE